MARGITQQDIDYAYYEGKRAYQKAFGGHGPSLKPHQIIKPANPYTQDRRLVDAWEKGWRGDVRRVIAPHTRKAT